MEMANVANKLNCLVLFNHYCPFVQDVLMRPVWLNAERRQLVTDNRRFLEDGEVERESFKAGFTEGYQRALKDGAKSKAAKLATDLGDRAKVALDKYVKDVKQMQGEGMKVVVDRT